MHHYTRRDFVQSLACGLLAAGLSRSSRANANALDVSVLDHGAAGDGVQDDTAAINAAISRAAQFPGSRVLFPRGTYRLAHSTQGELLALTGRRELALVGEDARLTCDTPQGTVAMLKLTDCEDVSIEGLAFRDLGADRNVEWRGAVAIYLTGYGVAGNRRIRIANCTFDNMLAALTVSDGGGQRASNLQLNNLRISRGYYGLNFQNNGDDVTATAIRCDDVKRSYFPYGVRNHRIELDTASNGTGFTDVLIKCYGRETADLRVKVRCRGKRSGDAIVAFDQQHPSDRGVIRDIDVELDVADADCRLNSIVLMRTLSPQGKVLSHTRSQWRNIALSGTVERCASGTQMLTVGSYVDYPTFLKLGTGLARQVDRSRLRGVTIVETVDSGGIATQ